MGREGSDGSGCQCTAVWRWLPSCLVSCGNGLIKGASVFGFVSGPCGADFSFTLNSLHLGPFPEQQLGLHKAFPQPLILHSAGLHNSTSPKLVTTAGKLLAHWLPVKAWQLPVSSARLTLSTRTGFVLILLGIVLGAGTRGSWAEPGRRR